MRRAPDPARQREALAALRAPGLPTAPAAPVQPEAASAAPPSAAVSDAPAFVFAHPDAESFAPPPAARQGGAASAWVDVTSVPTRPRERPVGVAVSTAATSGVAAATATGPSLGSMFLAALRPEPRPRAATRQAGPAAAPEVVEPAAVVRPAPGASAPTSRRGALCGVPGLQGEVLAPIIGRVKGCGVAQPVRVMAVDGVRLSQGAIMDCETARALSTWVQKGLQPAFRGEVTGLHVAGHYVCRTRNHKRGARLSEHSTGKAIDISGIQLSGGQVLSIQRDWRGRQGAAIKAAHRAACGIFGTTLGPGSDGMHEDHLHFDTARQRNGAYCR
ncbi:MAG: extensin family protein [Gemmobacter sp.]|nr:extensin family protein [Gemmobacter sp.]